MELEFVRIFCCALARTKRTNWFSTEVLVWCMKLLKALSAHYLATPISIKVGFLNGTLYKISELINCQGVMT